MFVEEAPARVALERLLEEPKREAEAKLGQLAAEIEAEVISVASSIEDTLGPFDAILFSDYSQRAPGVARELRDVVHRLYGNKPGCKKSGAILVMR